MGDPERDRHEQEPGQCDGGTTGDLGERGPRLFKRIPPPAQQDQNAQALAARIRLWTVPARKAPPSLRI